MTGLIKAEEKDLEELYGLYRRTAEAMKEDGLNQWNWGVYPTEDMIREARALGFSPEPPQALQGPRRRWVMISSWRLRGSWT